MHTDSMPSAQATVWLAKATALIPNVCLYRDIYCAFLYKAGDQVTTVCAISSRSLNVLIAETSSITAVSKHETGMGRPGRGVIRRPGVIKWHALLEFNCLKICDASCTRHSSCADMMVQNKYDQYSCHHPEHWLKPRLQMHTHAVEETQSP